MANANPETTREIGEPMDVFLPEARDLFRAVCSNNLNIILAALDKASRQ